MKLSDMKYKNLTSGFILFFLQVIVLFYVFRFLYPFKEQFQMFQFTGQYAAATWKQAGGVALYLSEFLSRYYSLSFDFGRYSLFIDSEKNKYSE